MLKSIPINKLFYGICGAFILAISCGGDESSIRLELSPTQIPADGVDLITATAEIIGRTGNPVQDGEDVIFSISHGTFELFETIKSDEVETVGGKAEVQFYAPQAIPPDGVVTVTASYETANKETKSDSRSLEILPPTPVSTKYFSFNCTATNIGAFVSGFGEIRIPCSIVAKSNDGKNLPFAPIQFALEAGEMEEMDRDEISDERLFEYVVRENTSDAPADVEPNAEEVQAGLLDASQIKNARDGLVTMVAYTNGLPYFDDTNNNGMRDPGETFDAEGEPFLDIDDDGVYEEEKYALVSKHNWFADNNGNGERDPASGVFPEDPAGITIGRTFRILWSGSPDNTNSFISPNKIDICACEQIDFEVMVVDKYFNPPASFKPQSDEIEFDYPSNSNLNHDGPGFELLSNTHGMIFGSDTNFVDETDMKFEGFQLGGTPEVLQHRQWKVNVWDAQKDCPSDCNSDEGTCEAISNQSFEITYQYTPYPDASQIDWTQSAEGKVKDYFSSQCPGGQ